MEVFMAEEVKQEAKSVEAKAEVLKNVNALEKWLEGINKQLPQIPKKGQDVLAQLAPWLALAGGIFSLLSSWWFWQAGHVVNNLVNFSNSINQLYGSTVIDTSPRLGFSWYLALVLILVQAAIMLAAFPKLKDGKKSGWNLLFYNVLLGVLIGLVYVFTPGYGIFSLFGTLVGAAIGAYLLFQVRGHFTK